MKIPPQQKGAKKRLNVADEMWDKYSHHLSDVIKLREILRRVPSEIVEEILRTEAGTIEERI